MVKHYFCYTFLFCQFAESALQSYKPLQSREADECVLKIIRLTEHENITDVTLINLNDSLGKLLHNSLSDPVRFITRTFYWPNDTLYNDVYVIHFINNNHFLVGMDLVKRDPFWNPRAKFVIIVEELDNLEEVSIMLVKNLIFDVAIVTYDAKYHVVVYTFGLDRDECDRPTEKTLQLLSRCSDLRKTENVYVAERKTSLRGCHVKFVSHNYWPFVSFGGKLAVEQFLLSLVQEYENITVELVNYGVVEKFGSIQANFTYSGMLHEIELFNVEGAVGGYVLYLNRMLNLDFIDPYIVDHYKIIIARAPYLGKWTTVIKQLGIILVCIMFVTFCVCCTVVIFMETFRRKEQDISRELLIVWGYFLGNIIQKKDIKSGLPHRLLLLNILLYVFIVSCAIQASLLSANQKPLRGSDPSTIGEVSSNYQLLVSPSLNGYLEKNPIVNLTNSKHICKVTLDCITKIMNTDDKLYYTLASDLFHESYIWKFADEQGELRIKKISESVEILLQTMYIRRGSSLAMPFNRLFMWVQAGGFIQRFFNEIQYRERIKYSFAGPVNRLQSLRDLIGAFAILITGYLISTVLFVLELCRRKQRH